MNKKPNFSVKTPEDSPGLLLWQTTTLWQRAIKKALQPYDLSHTQFVIMAVTLWFTETQQETTQVNIANQSKLDNMTISQSLKKLTAKGLIDRQESQKDTRAKIVMLTAKGKKLIEQIVPIVEQTDADFFGAINHNGQQSLLKLFRDRKSVV